MRFKLWRIDTEAVGLRASGLGFLGCVVEGFWFEAGAV